MAGWSAVRLIPDKTVGPEQMTVDFSVVTAVEGRWVDGRPQDFFPGEGKWCRGPKGGGGVDRVPWEWLRAPPHQLRGLGSAVSSPSRVRSGAPAQIDFFCTIFDL